MKTKYAFALATFGSFALGGIAVQSLHAQAKPPAYVVAEVVISNQEAYAKEFLPPVRKTIADAGGKCLAAGGKTVSMEGAAPAPRVVIVQWDSLDQAQKWFNSPAAQESFAIGRKFATFRNFAVEGVTP